MVVGMVHVPINTVLAAGDTHRAALGLPSPSRRDWEAVRAFDEVEGQGRAKGSWARDFPSLALAEKTIDELREGVRELSFYRFLEDRMLLEAEILVEHGVSSLLLENVGAPYFVRSEQPLVVYGVLLSLAKALRQAHPVRPVGIQCLAFADNLAMDIAVRCALSFVRAESALFSGLRPEGLSPNQGNLARLYVARAMIAATLDVAIDPPEVFVDIRKKHTVFQTALETVETWLENVLFQKLEGIIVTGRSTGVPVDEGDLRAARVAVDRVRSETRRVFGCPWEPLLLVGSGVSVDNLEACGRHADGLIVGSSLKRNGYWECPLDPERVRQFMDAWHRSTKGVTHGST